MVHEIVSIMHQNYQKASECSILIVVSLLQFSCSIGYATGVFPDGLVKATAYIVMADLTFPVVGCSGGLGVWVVGRNLVAVVHC